jgi:hypothetical protein
MGIPTYTQWLQDTSLNVLKPRSSQLKAVDEAIQEYEKARNEKNLWRIKNAFEDWKRYKGMTWERSERNTRRAITVLNFELQKVADSRTYQITHFSMEELIALSHVAKERKLVLGKMFAGKEVSFKAVNKVKEQFKEAGQKVKETAATASSWLASRNQNAPPDPPKVQGRPAADIVREKMLDMAKTYFGVAGLELLGDLGALVIKILGECAVAIPPVVGHIKDGYDLFTGWAKVGADVYQEHNISERHYVIDTGAPSQAFAALRTCLRDETKNEAISATRATTSFALKTGLVFADGGLVSGPVVGAASALADFAHKMFLLGMEYRATKAINVSLHDGELDIRLFKTYPLMGCYLLVSATLSDLIPIESFGTPGWMDYIEHMKKNDFDEIYDAATDLIEASPWEILGLAKRPKKSTGGIFTEAKRVFSTLSPLGDLGDLRNVGKAGAA